MAGAAPGLSGFSADRAVVALPPVLQACDVLGVRCAVADVQSATEAIVARALARLGGHVVFCNVHVLITAQTDPSLRNALEDAWAVFADGAPVAWLQRRHGMSAARRVGGPDLMTSVVDAGRERGISHALFGSTQAVVDSLTARLLHRYPGARIV